MSDETKPEKKARKPRTPKVQPVLLIPGEPAGPKPPTDAPEPDPPAAAANRKTRERKAADPKVDAAVIDRKKLSRFLGRAAGRRPVQLMASAPVIGALERRGAAKLKAAAAALEKAGPVKVIGAAASALVIDTMLSPRLTPDQYAAEYGEPMPTILPFDAVVGVSAHAGRAVVGFVVSRAAGLFRRKARPQPPPPPSYHQRDAEDATIEAGEG